MVIRYLILACLVILNVVFLEVATVGMIELAECFFFGCALVYMNVLLRMKRGE